MRTNPAEMSRPAVGAPSAAVGPPPAQSTTGKGTAVQGSGGGRAQGPQAALPLLLLSRRLSLKRVGHEASVGSLGDKGMPRSHNLKAQKAEGPEQGGSVIAVLMEANEDVGGVQLLLRELEKNCEAVLAALGQGAAWDLDVEAAAAQHRSPVNVFGACEPGLDVQNPRLAVRR